LIKETSQQRNAEHGIADALARWANEGGAQAVPTPSKFRTGTPRQQEPARVSPAAQLRTSGQSDQEKWKTT
jgi:hypothetical protein